MLRIWLSVSWYAGRGYGLTALQLAYGTHKSSLIMHLKRLRILSLSFEKHQWSHLAPVLYSEAIFLIGFAAHSFHKQTPLPITMSSVPQIDIIWRLGRPPVTT